jgi:hypothetical protein
LDNSR